jgi:hypothetical protein
MSVARPHRKLVKHYHEPGDLHELTFSYYKRQPLLDPPRQQLQGLPVIHGLPAGTLDRI